MVSTSGFSVVLQTRVMFHDFSSMNEETRLFQVGLRYRARPRRFASATNTMDQIARKRLY